MKGMLGSPSLRAGCGLENIFCVTVSLFFCFSFQSILVLESCRGHVLTVCVSGDY